MMAEKPGDKPFTYRTPRVTFRFGQLGEPRKRVIKHTQCLYPRGRERSAELESAGDVNGYQLHVKCGISCQQLTQWRLFVWSC